MHHGAQNVWGFLQGKLRNIVHEMRGKQIKSQISRRFSLCSGQNRKVFDFILVRVWSVICEKLKICGSLSIIPSVWRERCQGRFQNTGPLTGFSLRTENMQAFCIFSYLVQSTAKYFKPVHPPCHTPNKIFYDNLLLLPLLLSLSP